MNTKRIRKLFARDGVVIDVILDKSKVIPDDPGQDTPAMVQMLRASGKQYVDSGTYWCAIGSGELSDKGTKLTEEQQDWLISLDTEVTEFLYRK